MKYFAYCLTGLFQPTCYLSLVTIPFLLILATLLLIFKSLYHKSNPIKTKYANSIFSHLKTAYPRSSYLLFILVAYGSFFFKPLGSIRFLIPYTSNYVKEYFSAIISALSTSFYLFSVIFILNFLAVKSDFVRSQGNPEISEKTRPVFLEIVVKQTVVISVIYLMGLLASLMSDVSVVNTTGTPVQWALRVIYYAFLLIMTIIRLHYVNHPRKMAQIHNERRRRDERYEYFNEHIRARLMPPSEFAGQIDRDPNLSDEEFLRSVEEQVDRQCRLSSEIWDENYRAVDRVGNNAVSLPRDPKEKYLIGSSWLIFTLMDSLCNMVVSAAVVVALEVGPDVYDDIAGILGWIIFGLNLLDIVIQSTLTYLIVTKNESLGPERQSIRGQPESNPSSVVSESSHDEFQMLNEDTRMLGSNIRYQNSVEPEEQKSIDN